MTDADSPQPKPGSSESAQSNPEGQSPEPNRTERRKRSDRRESVVDRRNGADRRTDQLPDMYERRGPGVRRSKDRRAAEEGEMTDEQWEFLRAIDAYKQANNKPFPTWTEVLEVIKKLGYRRADPPCDRV